MKRWHQTMRVWVTRPNRRQVIPTARVTMLPTVFPAQPNPHRPAFQSHHGPRAAAIPHPVPIDERPLDLRVIRMLPASLSIQL